MCALRCTRAGCRGLLHLLRLLTALEGRPTVEPPNSNHGGCTCKLHLHSHRRRVPPQEQGGRRSTGQTQLCQKRSVFSLVYKPQPRWTPHKSPLSSVDLPTYSILWKLPGPALTPLSQPRLELRPGCGGVWRTAAPTFSVQEVQPQPGHSQHRRERS